MAIANSVRWYGHVLRREDGHILRNSLDFEVEVHKKSGRLNGTWNKQVEEESMDVGLSREDALFQSKWIVGVNLIATRLR